MIPENVVCARLNVFGWPSRQSAGRIEFNDFAKVWLRLATEFEKDNALLDMWSGPENGPHEAWPRRFA